MKVLHMYDKTLSRDVLLLFEKSEPLCVCLFMYLFLVKVHNQVDVLENIGCNFKNKTKHPM
jgi:hypothetical protein